jgi:hypothetical protein
MLEDLHLAGGDGGAGPLIAVRSLPVVRGYNTNAESYCFSEQTHIMRKQKKE